MTDRKKKKPVVIKLKFNPFKFSKKNYDPSHSHLLKRKAREKRFVLLGKGAVFLSIAFLIIMLGSIIGNGYSAFVQTQLKIPVNLSTKLVKEEKYRKIIQNSLKEMYPEITSRKERFLLYKVVSKGSARKIKKLMERKPHYIGTTKYIWLTASSDIDMYYKGKVSKDVEQSRRKIKDIQISIVDTLKLKKATRIVFNFTFFSKGDSREPEQAGILGSTIGSLFTILVCMLISFPIAVGAAVYLEEFAPKNKFTDFIEVNINNLAAVPSVIFGLLALAVYINFFGMPRSSSLVGGFALSMLVLPVIVISTRSSLSAVPPTIRYAALALGATNVQVVIHHTLPYSLPGIITGTILGIARALGETAPLLMIGMVAFIVDVPTSILDPATSLPTQIYLWADSSEMGFLEKTSACILILLFILAVINYIAAVIRNKFKYEW